MSRIRGSYKSAILSHEENVKYDHILSQLDVSISHKWILLYNHSMLYVLLNKYLLWNVRKFNHDLAILLTGRNTTTNLVGDLSGYGTVWFHARGISNILSLSKLGKKYRL